MFEPLPTPFNFPEAEKRVLAFWKQHDVFRRSLEQRRGAPRFVFYEGPPTANGLPHPGHCLTRAIKDLFPRYQTMCGKLVERKAGWDTHGLPVEVEVCKELGIHTKEEIEAFGVEKFIRKCIESVFRYTREWEEVTERLGFWLNLEEAYVTFHQSYVESVWWSLKTLFERGLLYQGHKIVWWWCQGGTALSAGEVGEGYRTVKDPSVYIRFPLLSTLPEPADHRPRTMDEVHAVARDTRGRARAALGRPLGDDALVDAETLIALDPLYAWLMLARELANETPAPAVAEPRDVLIDFLGRRDPDFLEKLLAPASLLVWTTTPWTLISNHFAAVHPEQDYILAHNAALDENLVILSTLLEEVQQKTKLQLEPLLTLPGKALVGQRYLPPFFVYYDAPPPSARHDEALAQEQGEGDSLGNWKAWLDEGGADYLGWRVVAADFVTLDTGTGVVHIAPGYGEVDFDLLLDERKRFTGFEAIPLINAVAPDGTFTAEAPRAYRGRWVKDCDKDIMRELKDRGLLLHQETIEHEYPFCPRAEDDPLIQYARKSWFVRTSQFKDEFLKNNAAINWLPEHIQEGRFGDFLRNNVDWALSRERYWGTPLPIWVCEKTGKMEAIGSYAELLAKPGATDGGAWERAKAADPTLPDHLRVHKPYIDEWTYDSPFSGEHGPPARMRRVPEVIDCWWDAGSMPFAQWGFPHAPGSPKTFADRFPADFISEAIDQTRGWFYGLLAISTLLYKVGVLIPGSMGLRPVRPPQPQPVLPITADFLLRRRILPHWEAGGSTYYLTFRLYRGELTAHERTFVLDACRHWDGQRMLLHAAVIMPDHVHLLCTPLESAPGVWWSVADLMHSIKGYTATQLNKQRGTSGPFWQQEYYDRIIRDVSDFQEKWAYVVTNPQRCGLPEDYPWVWVEPSHAAKDGPEAHAPPIAYPHPYKTCIVLGHIAGEDGNKMSKRLRNYKEPAYIFDHYGADAMRWYFFCGQAPWTSIRFQEASIRDAHREFLMRLYNVFSFFNIYANIDGFEARPAPECGHRPTAQRSELDRWIISELHRTIKFVRESMDRFENFPAAGRINQLVDALSNWYVRRSRERFWRTVQGSGFSVQDSGETAPGNPKSKIQNPKSDADQDKWDAYHTLYGCLLTLSELIAPFTPFFAETMYQNLVNPAAAAGSGQSKIQNPKSKIADVPLSVHLCDYPLGDETLIDEQLAAEMDLVREIVSLGRAARTAAKLKVRQPLALAEIVLARPEHAAWLAAHADLIADELNIKQVEFTAEADHYVTYQVKPEFKVLGPKFGKLAPQIAAALGTVDAADARRTLSAAGELVVQVDGQPVRLTDQEVHVRLEAKPGWSATQGRAGVVVVKTELTPELIEEGLIREVIHHVQGLRKDLNLPYEARITLYVEADAALQRVIARFADTVKHECLADEIVLGAPPSGAVHEAKIEGHPAKLAVVPR